MKVILVGYAKTGTTSLCSALNQLGYKTYHWYEHFQYAYDDWMKLMTSGGSISDFQRMFKDVDAVADSPVVAFWEDICNAFPNAKIILTIRDEDEWYSSVKFYLKRKHGLISSRLMFTFTPTGRRYFHFARNSSMLVFGFMKKYPWSVIECSNDMVMKRFYRSHTAHVMTNAPKDRLLVYNVKDGWEPLCKFLNKSIPDEPFPRKNVREKSIEEQSEHPVVVKMKREFYLRVSCLFIGIGLLCGYKIMKYCSA